MMQAFRQKGVDRRFCCKTLFPRRYFIVSVDFGGCPDEELDRQCPVVRPNRSHSMQGSHVMSKKLAGKVAMVTGASKGIGASIANHLADEGAAVVVNYSSWHG